MGLDDIREKMAEQADFLVKRAKENPPLEALRKNVERCGEEHGFVTENPPYQRDEDRFRELVNEAAESIASDISGDNPDVDTSYEVYVFILDAQMIGFVYMGECGEWAYEWTTDNKVQMCFTPGILERAKKLSPYRTW